MGVVLGAVSEAIKGTGVLDRVFLVALLVILGCVSATDIRTRTIPNGLCIMIALLGIARVIAGSVGWLAAEMPVTVLDAVLGACAASLPLLALASLSGGVGGGDIKLMAAAGVFLGWRSALLALAFGCVLGAIAGIILMLSGRATRKSTIAFGPYLCAGIALAAVCGPMLRAMLYS